jgi:uncharacterized membrane protein HdeD (DUF308 family)
MVDIHDRSGMPLWTEPIRRHWELYLIEGIVLMVLGAGAILIPAFASLAVAIFLGWLFLIGGVVGAVTTLMSRTAPGFWWSLLSATITIIAGLLLLGWPFVGVVSLTIILAAFLAADGIFSIMFAIEHRRQLSRRWGWLVVNGVIDLILAAVILWLTPLTAAWALGIFVGIDFIFGGASLIAMALAARHAHA